MTPCRTYYIDFSQQEVHEAGALLVTLLAYPSDDQKETARCNLHATLCYLVLRGSFDHEPHDNTPQLMKPVHASRDMNLVAKDHGS